MYRILIVFFFLNDTPTTVIYTYGHTLSLHDALPIYIMRAFEGDTALALITAKDEDDALELVRHDYAHVLAEAVQHLFPGTQITFGPATEEGFYYDFATAPYHGPFTEDDLPAVEEEMSSLIARDEPPNRKVWASAEINYPWRT